MLLKTIWLIGFNYLLIVSNSLNSQTLEILSEKVYSDYELDYYPHFKLGYDNGFHEVFKDVLNNCGFNIAEIQQIKGNVMRLYGMPPKNWEGRTIMYLLIDEKGIIHKISFGGVEVSQALKSCFEVNIKRIYLYPGLINYSPVKCEFSFLLIEKSKTHTKRNKVH